MQEVELGVTLRDGSFGFEYLYVSDGDIRKQIEDMFESDSSIQHIEVFEIKSFNPDTDDWRF